MNNCFPLHSVKTYPKSRESFEMYKDVNSWTALGIAAIAFLLPKEVKCSFRREEKHC